MSTDPQPQQSPAPSPTHRPFFRLFRIFAVAYLLVVLAMMFMEESLIFFPAKYPEGYWTALGPKFEDANFQAADGTKLHGWFVEHENPRAVILFAHGNAGNLSHRGDIVLEMSHQLRASVMIFDYRGYGRSEGKPDEAGILADARAARAWLANRAKVPEQEIVLFGESIGAAVMVDLAAKDGARGLILENPFTSVPDVATRHFPWLPVKLMMRTRLDSKSKIPNYKGPLLVLHGDCDTIVPYQQGQQLFAAANEPKTFVTMKGCDHNDPRTPAFMRALDKFLSQLEN